MSKSLYKITKMKKTLSLILFLLCTLSSHLSNSQPVKKKYIEVNTGFATGIVPFFPGASVLYGATNYYPSGFLLDYEGGLAFPTALTGKIGFGCLVNKDEITVGIRPFPATYYAQIRIDRPTKNSDIILSVESGLYYRSLLSQTAIITIGWRWDNKRYSDIRRK
jgi:hypothetical protein